MGRIEVRNWDSFVSHDNVGAESAYQKAIVQLAVMQAIEEEESPEIDDEEEIFNNVAAGRAPEWWPKKLERVFVQIRATPAGNTTEQLGPSPIDPNNNSLGLTLFGRIIENLLGSTGDSFDGMVQINILRGKTRQKLGGIKAEVFVGEALKK